MRGIATVPSYVIMQPTTLCNLDCRYCYLPLRAHDRRMPVEVAGAVAASVNEYAQVVPPISVAWHGGNPLHTTGEFESARRVDPQVIVKFLEAWKPAA